VRGGNANVEITRYSVPIVYGIRLRAPLEL
jgi:hypothetical protein